MRGQERFAFADRIRRLEGRYLQYTAHGFLLLFWFLLQMTPGLLPAVAGARPLLLIPAVACVGMFTDPVAGGVCGAVAGFAWDMFSGRMVGLSALYLLAVGCACGLLVQLLMRNNALSALLLGGAATLGQVVLDWLTTCVLWRLPGSFSVLFRHYLPVFLYTLALTLPLYYITRGVAKHLKTSR